MNSDQIIDNHIKKIVGHLTEIEASVLNENLPISTLMDKKKKYDDIYSLIGWMNYLKAKFKQSDDKKSNIIS